MRRRIALGTALLFASVSFAADAAQPVKPLKPLSFRAEARVDIDTDGKLIFVEASKDLPEPVRAYIHQQLATWTYKRRDLAPHGIATTWLNLRACAMPTTAGSYAMGLAYYGSGPMVTAFGPMVTLAQVVGRHGLQGTINAHISVGANGKVELESLEGDSGSRRVDARLAAAIREWVGKMVVQQELLDGQPVPVRSTIPLELRQGSPAQPTRSELLAQALESPQCKQAGQQSAAATVQALQSSPEDLIVAIEPKI